MLGVPVLLGKLPIREVRTRLSTGALTLVRVRPLGQSADSGTFLPVMLQGALASGGRGWRCC